MTNAWLNVAAWLPASRGEGPGLRAVLWVQGCDKRCPGCCNPGLLPIVTRELVTAASMVEKMMAAKDAFGIEGITFLGGEPMLQAKGLAEVAAAAQAAGLSVMVFTGYTVEELTLLALDGAQALLGATDVLVDGPYRADQPDTTRSWVGSKNQQFHYLTARYSAAIEPIESGMRDLEIRIGHNGTARINGWPTQMLRKIPYSAVETE